MTWLAHHACAFLLTLAVVAGIVVALRVAEYLDRVGDRRAAARSAAVVDGIVADAQAAYAAYVQSRAGAALLDDLAVLHPMPQRPAPPPAGPGEPWRLRPAVGADDLSSGLVDPGAPNQTLNGETR